VKRDARTGLETVMNYEMWAKSVPVEITGDSLWKMEAYRLALFASDLGWHDVTRLTGDRRTLDLAGQLCRALGSIEANISEGYSRGSGRDRARFYEYALGSARETRGWYYKGRFVLGERVAAHRLQLLTQIVCLLLAMVPDQRAYGSFLKEDAPAYQSAHSQPALEPPPDPELLSHLLQDVPMP
jgi:four helix bundle protein